MAAAIYILIQLGLIIAKLTAWLTWSWWLVLAPFSLPFVVGVANTVLRAIPPGVVGGVLLLTTLARLFGAFDWSWLVVAAAWLVFGVALGIHYRAAQPRHQVRQMYRDIFN